MDQSGNQMIQSHRRVFEALVLSHGLKTGHFVKILNILGMIIKP